MRILEQVIAIVLAALTLVPSPSLAADGVSADFVSVCFEGGCDHIDVEMSVSYAKGTVGEVSEYLYIRVDAGSEGFRWLPPSEEGDTLSWSFSLEEGQRAAFWLLDDGENPSRLDIRATGEGQVSARTVGLFHSDLADLGEGRFSLPDATVAEDAEDKAGIPNAKVLLCAEPSAEQEGEADKGDDHDAGGDQYATYDAGEEPRDQTDIEQTGDAIVLVCSLSIAGSLAAFLFMRRKRK